MGKIKPYVKTDWVPGVTPVTRENMTNIEEQVESITNVLVEASSTDKSAGAIVVRNSEGKVEGDIAGNSGTTTKFDKKKLLKVTGVVNGQVQFDGSEEGDKIEIATTLDKGYQQLLDQKLECFLNTKHMQGCPTLGLGQYCYVINDIVVDGSRLYEVIDYAGEVKLDNGLWARLVPRKTITGDLNDLMFALTEKILEGLGTLEQYMHAAENGGNANSVQGYVPRNFKRTEDTIADLVSSASNKYRIGDVVELNGYYTAGDGAHHKRKIESADDGSGVQLANGLWANIVHNGEVNVSWFGAKGDGVTDDTVAFEKLDGLRAKIPQGVFVCSNLKFSNKTQLLGVGIEKSILKQKKGSSGDFIILENWSNGLLEHLTITSEGGITKTNTKQALVKMRTNKSIEGYNSLYRSRILNCWITNGEHSGIVVMSNGDNFGDGFTSGWSWIYSIDNTDVTTFGEYCVYNRSTDNRFSNMNISDGLLCSMFENGSSNVWSNVKVDGLGGRKTVTGDLIGSVDDGAGVIIKNCGMSSFVNLDIQSAGFVGLKLINVLSSKIDATFNNSGSASGINNGIGVILNNVQSTNLNFSFSRYERQNIPIKVVKNVFSNTIIANHDWGKDVEREYYKEACSELLKLGQNNKVIFGAMADRDYNCKFIKFVNLTPSYDFTDTSKIIATQLDTTKPFLNSNCAILKPNFTNVDQVRFVDGIKLKHNTQYLICCAVKVTKEPSSLTGTTTDYPYISVVTKAGASVGRPISLKNDNGTIFLGYIINSSMLDVYEDDFEIFYRVYSTKTDGEFLVTNMCVYESHNTINTRYPMSLFNMLGDKLNLTEKFSDFTMKIADFN